MVTAAAHDATLDDRFTRRALAALALAWGVQAIVTQSLLLREAQVLMFGSEFAWGVVFFAWLLGVAVGAAAGGWFARRLRRPDVGLVIVLLVLGVGTCIELWAFRGARSWLGVEAGELLPLPATGLAALLFVSPASAPVGLAFPLACCVGLRRTSTEARTSGALQLGQVYALESAGALIGGAAFSFWLVEQFAPIEAALLCLALNATAGAILLYGTSRRVSAAWPGLIAVLAVMCWAGFGEQVDRALVLRRWANVAPGYELVDHAESRYQSLALGKLAGQFSIYSDGHVAGDFPDPYTFVPLAHFWMCQHPAPQTVLVLGGGAEGLLAEILLHPVRQVDYVEPDARQLELITPHLPAEDRAALADPRVIVHHVDARFYVKTQRGRFDLVIARLPEPTSAQRARFYTDEFYDELRWAMTERAVLCTSVSAAPGALPVSVARYVASVRAGLKRHFDNVVVSWGDPAQVLAASDGGLITTDPAELMRRHESRNVQSDLFHPAWFAGAIDWLDPDKLAARSAELDEITDPPLSTDLWPRVYLDRLAIWDRMTAGETASVIPRLRSVSVWHIAAILAVAGVGTMGFYRMRARDRSGWAGGAVIVSIASTGLATMALSIVWLFAFQNLYGYVYQRIAWIIAVFMGGLVIGSMVTNRRINRADRAAGFSPRGSSMEMTAQPDLATYLRNRLIAVDVLLAALAFAVPFVLPALSNLQAGPRSFVLVEWSVLGFVLLTGVLGGAAFPLAGRLRLDATGTVAGAAGGVDAADHAGACAGALLCGIVLVPVFGTTATAFLLGGIKLASAGVLAGGGMLSRGSRGSGPRG